MAGLVKPKKYDWKDSNLALFGSDTEKQVKKSSAQAEPAWHGAGQKVGLQIWRIVDFKVTEWDRKLYGQFFNGDSYIILNTYKPDPSSEELAYDLHFWIGANSSQDEYGTAAYKTVELDTYLDDKPVQHREVEGFESERFKSYFPKGIMLLEGGADSGFHHVEPEKYTPRLFHFHGQGKNIVAEQVPAVKTRLTSGDVFVLDLGLKVYQWNGTSASPFEKNKALQFVENLKNERSGKAVEEEVVDESSSGPNSSHPFYAALTGTDTGDQPKLAHKSVTDAVPHLFRISDSSGTLKVDKVKTGGISAGDLKSDDVFLLATSDACYVWIGKGASTTEKQNGMAYAHNHLKTTDYPTRPVVVLKEGAENKEFKMALAA